MTSGYPPHLPPPTCNVKRHHEWQRLKTVALATVFGLLAGIAGASVLLGWIWAGWGAGDTWIGARADVLSTHRQVEQQAEDRVSDKIVTLYAKGTTVNGVTVFAPQDALGTGVVAVSSGWIAAYLPNFTAPTKDWRALLSNGTVLGIGRSVFDPATGYAYLQLLRPGAGGDQQFKVATFGDTADRFADAYVYQDGRWYPTYFTNQLWLPTPDGHVDTVPRLAYALNNAFAPGSIVIDSQGRVLGFVTDGTTMLSAAFVDHALPGIESATHIMYPSLGVAGWYDEERPIIINGKETAGLLVNKVVAKKSSFRKGDVILTIDDHVVAATDLWYTISDKPMQVKVWRNGKEMEMTVSKTEI